MPFIKTQCPVCHKTFESSREFQLGSVIAHLGKCGHILKQDQMEHKDARHCESLDGKKPYPFQALGVEFLESANGRALIADEMGLGKTVQALIWLALHQEATPALLILKKSLTTQWQHEVMRWIGEDHFAQIISDSRTDFLPGLKYYIISYDLLPEFDKCPKCHHAAHRQGVCDGKRRTCQCELDSSSQPGEFARRVETRGIKTLIIDECQQIKNPEAQRTVAVRALARQKTTEHIIALSGTPIKNAAIEYFPILNILHPEIFPRLAQFQQWWCQSYWNGYSYKTGGLANPKLFAEKTKSFIIRRERKEVMPELPLISRRFSFHDLSKEVEKAYLATLKEFQLEWASSGMSGFSGESNLLAYLSKMRHLTGLSKIDSCIDFIMEFLGSTDRKLTVFVHHKDVGEILMMRLASLMQELELAPPLQLVSEMSDEQRSECVTKFMSQEDKAARVLIASTLASGEGLNLQKCSDCIMLERQWNPANEEQAEGRFIRIGQLADAVTATYFIAVGTVDEFFSEIVERKRETVIQTLGGEAIKWDQSSLIKELGEVLAVRGGQKWGF